MAETENKKRKRKVAIALTSVLVGSLIFGAGILGLKDCFQNDDIPPVQTESPIVTPDPTDPIVTPDPTDPIVTPDPTENPQYTEAEYREMCVEKIEEIFKDYINNKYSKELTDFKFETIDTLNGIVYSRGYVAGNGNMFLSFNLDNEKTNVETYQELYNGCFKNSNRNDILSLNTSQDLSKLVTTESYNAFLNGVVSDQEYIEVLDNEGIEVSSNIINWKDVSTVVNIKEHNNQNLDVIFVDLNNNKTITIRVNAYLTIQESSSLQKMIDNMINKTKSYEIVNIGEYKSIVKSIEATLIQ